MEERFVTSFDGSKLYCRIDGDPRKPVILFANSLCCTVQMWDAQVAELSETHSLIRYDYRGHGRSAVSDAACTLDMLARDALAILNALHIDKVNFVGLSLGGLIGMYLGAHAPERLERLVLCNTSPYIPTREKWDERIRLANEQGMDGIALNSFQRWLTPGFAGQFPHFFQALVQQAREIPPQGYANLCAALRDADMRNELNRIEKPTMVIGSSGDVTSPEQIRGLAGAIKNAELRMIEDAGHLSNVDQPAVFTRLIKEFFEQVELTVQR
jgi:3-oxoadipate enol-lactonase